MLDFKNINECIMNYYHLPIKTDANENYLSKIIDYVHDLKEIDKTTYLLKKYKLSEILDLSNLYNFEVNDHLMDILKKLEGKTFREQEKIIIKLEQNFNIFNAENNKTINVGNTCFILFSFLEYLCSKNILNSILILKNILKKVNPEKYGPSNMMEIMYILKIIYKGLNLNKDFEGLNDSKFIHYGSNDITYTDDNFKKDFLKLINSCC